MSSFDELDISGVKGISISGRESKVRQEQSGKPAGPEGTVEEFLDGLPKVLGASDLMELATRIADSRANGRPVLWMIGGHVIKCGVTPYLVDLMKRGLITAVAMNGAAAIHDFEMTVWGHTSEDVERALSRGEFGMTEETARLMNGAISGGASKGWGIGESLGRLLGERKEAGDVESEGVVSTAWELRLPITVHVALGTDVIHQHPEVDPEAIGKGTYIDFKVLAAYVSGLGGGVVINAGSAVIMPEVFIKAFSIARNLGHDVGELTAANMDFIQHYRPTVNVLRRPVSPDGKSYALTGHHEIMIPLLAGAVRLAARRSGWEKA
jgi:hypothetical protein